MKNMFKGLVVMACVLVMFLVFGALSPVESQQYRLTEQIFNLIYNNTSQALRIEMVAVSDDLDIGDDVNVGGDANITGAANITGDAEITGDVSIVGDLTTGAWSQVSFDEVDVQSYTLASAGKASRLLSSYSGTAASTIHFDTDLLVAGREIVVQDIGGAANTYNITIDTEGAELINGGATLALNTAYQRLTCITDGTAWYCK